MVKTDQKRPVIIFKTCDKICVASTNAASFFNISTLKFPKYFAFASIEEVMVVRLFFRFGHLLKIW